MSTNDRTLSIVVCTLDRAHKLQNALESFAVARRPLGFAYELIVVDNGSTDATRAVVDAGHHQHGEVGVALAHRGEQLHAGDARHVDVGNQELEAALAELVERGLARGRGLALVPLELEATLDELADVGLVVDDQYAGLGSVHGVSTRGNATRIRTTVR